MKVTSAFIANHAEVRESLIFASGAFPEFWMIPALNLPQPLAFVATIEVEEAELGKAYNYIVGVEPPDGASTALAFFNSRRDLSEHETLDGPIYNLFALNFGVGFSMEGLFHFVLSTSGEGGVDEIARVPLLVRLAGPAIHMTAKADVRVG